MSGMNGISAPTGQSLYFGKLPSRGDFVRSSAGSALIRGLDHWLSQTMTLMSDDPRWKIVYDAASPVHFAVLGSQNRVGLVGHLATSHDASGRRFPFVMAASFDVPEPQAFLPYCPQALSPLWHHLDQHVRQALGTPDFTQVQDTLLASPGDVEQRHDVLRQAYKSFAQMTTVEGLEAALPSLSSADPAAWSAASAPPFSLRQSMLALGLLLQPVLSQGHAELNKGLALPLPRDPMQLPHVLTLWVDLVSRFFRRSSAELSLFITLHRQQPVLVIGFHGASPATLRSVLDAEVSAAENVQVAHAQWVEDWIGHDHGLRKFSNLLRDPSLSVAAAVDMFREVFLGE